MLIIAGVEKDRINVYIDKRRAEGQMRVVSSYSLEEDTSVAEPVAILDSLGSDPDSLVIYERWESQEALAAHGQSAHMAEFQKVMAANPPVGRDLRVYQTDEGNPL